MARYNVVHEPQRLSFCVSRQAVKANVTIDWSLRENVRANLRVIIKRILRRYGYPPDKQAKATETVLEQAELLCEGWA
jgi:type I restriction enzyme R subunit